jgi:hypothetical protein
MKFSRTPNLGTLALYFLPLAAGAAVRVLEVLEVDPAARAETRFLSLWVTTFLFALVAHGGPRREAGLWLTALGAVGVMWAAPPAPLRGALLGAVLVAAFLAAVVDTVRRGRPGPREAVALALAGQLVARPGLLLGALGVREVVSLAVLPMVAGLALWWLGRGREPWRVAVVGAVAFLLTPGWNVTTTFAVVALALAAFLAAAPGDGRRRSLVLALWLALAVLRFPEGMMAALAGAMLAWKRRAMVPVILLAGGVVLATVGVPVPTRAMVAVFLGGLALVPGGLLAERGSRALALVGIALLAAGALLGLGTAVLAPGLGLLALALPDSGPVSILQRRWLVLAGAGTLLLAAYPWIRSTPREDTFTWIGMGGVWAVVLPLIVVVVGGLALRLAPPAHHGRLAGGVLGLWLLLVAVVETGPVEVLVDNYRAVVLHAEEPRMIDEVDAAMVSEVVLDTNLVQGTELALGTPVAVVRLWHAEEGVLISWPLRAGRHTAEWASARPDVAQRMEAVPNPWLSQVAPSGDFFAERYRARWRLPEPVTADQITVSLDKDLPPGVRLAIYHLEVRP